MSITRRAATLGGLSLLAGTSVSTVSRAELGSFLGIGEGFEDFILATDAYIFGYPLVTMEMTRRVITNVADPGRNARADGPNHQATPVPRCFVPGRNRAECRHALHDRVLRPWKRALGAQHSGYEGRYALFPMLDGWTTVFQVPGKRTTGTGAQTYAVTGPGWKGTLPAGVKEYKCPTNIVWLLGRIYCTGRLEDYAEVHKLQDEFKLVPLSSYGKPYTPPAGTVDPSIDMKTAVREQVNRMDAVAYFTLLCKLMKENPPAARMRLNSPSLRGLASSPVRTSMRPSSRRISSSACPRSASTGSCSSSRSTRTSRTRTAGPIRPRPASTVPTI